MHHHRPDTDLHEQLLRHARAGCDGRDPEAMLQSSLRAVAHAAMQSRRAELVREHLDWLVATALDPAGDEHTRREAAILLCAAEGFDALARKLAAEMPASPRAVQRLAGQLAGESARTIERQVELADAILDLDAGELLFWAQHPELSERRKRVLAPLCASLMRAGFCPAHPAPASRTGDWPAVVTLLNPLLAAKERRRLVSTARLDRVDGIVESITQGDDPAKTKLQLREMHSGELFEAECNGAHFRIGERIALSGFITSAAHGRLARIRLWDPSSLTTQAGDTRLARAATGRTETVDTAGRRGSVLHRLLRQRFRKLSDPAISAALHAIATGGPEHIAFSFATADPMIEEAKRFASPPPPDTSILFVEPDRLRGARLGTHADDVTWHAVASMRTRRLRSDDEWLRRVCHRDATALYEMHDHDADGTRRTRVLILPWNIWRTNDSFLRTQTGLSRNAEITITTRLSDTERRRFMLWHEVGHAFDPEMTGLRRGNENSNDHRRELFADCFSVFMLIRDGIAPEVPGRIALMRAAGAVNGNSDHLDYYTTAAMYAAIDRALDLAASGRLQGMDARAIADEVTHIREAHALTPEQLSGLEGINPGDAPRNALESQLLSRHAEAMELFTIRTDALDRRTRQRLYREELMDVLRLNARDPLARQKLVEAEIANLAKLACNQPHDDAGQMRQAIKQALGCQPRERALPRTVLERIAVLKRLPSAARALQTPMAGRDRLVRCAVRNPAPDNSATSPRKNPRGFDSEIFLAIPRPVRHPSLPRTAHAKWRVNAGHTMTQGTQARPDDKRPAEPVPRHTAGNCKRARTPSP